MKKKDTTYLFNHVHVQIYFHKGTNGFDGRIVRAMVRLASCKTSLCQEPLSLPKNLKDFTDKKPFVINYTYAIDFTVSVFKLLAIKVSCQNRPI